jgi:hypothetical protein
VNDSKRRQNEEEIIKLLQGQLERDGQIIKSFDIMTNEEIGPFLCGKTLTWADCSYILQ